MRGVGAGLPGLGLGTAGWLVQEVTTRLPSRADAAGTAFASAADLAGALRRAEVAHRA